MGKYGYKFIGTDGFAMHFTNNHNKSLSSEQSHNVNNNITVNIKLADGQTSKNGSCEKPDNATASEQNMADCVSKLAISLAKHKQKYNL